MAERRQTRQHGLLAVLLLLPFLLGGCNNTATDGEDIEQGPQLLRYPSESGSYVYYQDIGGFGRINGIYRIDLADSIPKAELILDRAWFPAVSPNGRQLAYVAGGLRVMDLETRESQLVVNADVVHASWYGEDTLVYVLFFGDIYVVDIHVKEPREIYALGGFPDVASDGRIAFVYGGSIKTINLDGTGIQELYSVDDIYHETFGYPDWSPNGQEVVFGYQNSVGPVNEVRALSLRDSVPTIRSLARNALYPTFSEDGQHVLYVQIDPGLRKKLNGQIWIMDATDGSNKRQLTTWEMMRD